MERYDAIVIGAGHNGLIAACYLARAGKRVLVLERRDIVGGACVTEEVWPGYRVSTAAYLCSLLRPEIVRDLELEHYGFEVYRRETSGFAPFPDGQHLSLFPDEALTRAELERFCHETPEDVAAYFRFEADVERAAEVVEKWLLHDPPSWSELRSAFDAAGCGELYAPFVTGSVRALLDSRFRNEQLKAVLATDGLIGTYGGPGTPGTAYVLLHHYLGMILGVCGGWGYVRGGMGHITQSLAKVLQSHGGEIRTNAPVSQILTKIAPLLKERGWGEIRGGNPRVADLGLHSDVANLGCTEGASSLAPLPGERGWGEVLGVRLDSGEEIAADTVLSNADPYHTFEHLAKGLLPQKDAAPAWNRLVTQGGPSTKINLAVTELPRFTCLPQRENHSTPGSEHLGTVHLCPDMETLERAWDEARRGIPSTEPMIEVYLQTATDASIAPPGCHILSLFTQYFPYNLAPGLDLDTERERYADRVVKILGQYAPNVPASILHRQILTPRDLEARFGLTGGHIFHGDLLPPTLWDARPAPGFHGARTPLSGLYLCGSGAHPGGCVFGAPGYNAARAVLNDIAEKHS